MKTVSKNISEEIEFLGALARMLERDSQSCEATQEALAAMQHLLQVIDRQPDSPSESIPIAA